MTLDLARLEALEKAAAPRPWRWDEHVYIWGPSGMLADCDESPFEDEPATPKSGTCALLHARGVGSGQPIDTNMQLVAEMRNALPELIAAAKSVDQLRARLAEAERLLERVNTCWADATDRRHFSSANMKLATDIDAFLARPRETESVPR